MASRLESGVVYAAGAVQGIVLVTFPAASTIFTSPTEYGLSSTQYGTLFLPQVVLAIAAAIAAFGLAGTELPAVYRWASVIAVAMGVVSFAVRRRDSARP